MLQFDNTTSNKCCWDLPKQHEGSEGPCRSLVEECTKRKGGAGGGGGAGELGSNLAIIFAADKNRCRCVTVCVGP